MNDLTSRSLRGLAGFLVVLAVLIFLPAWTLSFWQGWLYWAVTSAALIAISVYFLKTDPALVERRVAAGPGAEKERSQQVIQSLASVVVVSLIVVPGLDDHFGWSAMPGLVSVLGDVLTVLGFMAIFVVFKTNTYTASTVQVEAEQTVISSGPYGLVRHPMYASAVLLFAGAPLALGSWWGLLLVAPMVAILVSRLLDEEKYLSAHLAGYDAYRAQIRKRLIPGLW